MTDARHLVDKRDPLLLQFGQRLVDVLHLEADVIEAAFSLRDHALVLAVGCGAGNELNHGFAHRVQGQLADGICFGAAQRDAEAVFPELSARLDVSHDDPDMLDAFDFHGWPRWK